MDISQYKDLIEGFIIIVFVMIGVDAILKVTFLDRTLGDLFLRIGIVVITVCVGYGIIIRIF